MPIPDNIIDEILEKTDIVEVISRHVPLKKAGRNFKAPCPFHHEKTPSFMVSPDKQIYHCFGCGAGGNAFSFLMRYENITFPEAAEALAQNAGIALQKLTPQKREMATLAEHLYKINEAACQFFQSSLNASPAAKEYLSSRSVGEETIKGLRIGYAPDSWDSLLNFFSKKGLDARLLEKAGLVIANDRGGYYDRFRRRIIFPISDLRNRILGFGGRVLDGSLPKYMNSPETVVYSKGKSLYGLNLSRESIKKENHSLVVEGYLDFIVPFQAGITNMVATLGTALTVDQIKMLKRFSNTAIMVYDPDEAGEAASLRNLDLFISEDMNVYIAELPAGFDPDSYIKKFGAEEFKKLIKSSRNIFDYKLAKTSSKFDMRTAHGKAAIAGEMLPTIARLNNEVIKSNLIKKLGERLGVDEEALKAELKKVKLDYTERSYFTVSPVTKKSSADAEKMVLALMLESGRFADKVKDELGLSELKDTSVRDVAKAIFDLREKGKEINPARMINQLEGNTGAAVLVSEAVNISEMIVDKDKTLSDCIARIKKDNMKERLSRIQEAIRLAHESKDDNGVKRLVTEYNELVKANKA